MPRILLVDDSSIDRKLIGSILGRIQNVEVLYAVDGSDALAQIDQAPPDLVVTDLEMPRMGGLELVGRLKEAYPMLPVILITAAGSEEIAVRALQAGAASYVAKRSAAREIWNTVAKVLRVCDERRTHLRVLKRLTHWATEFSIENDQDLIAALSAYLMQSFSGLQLCTSAEQLHVGVALDEALLNAYYHGNLEVSSKLREADYNEFFNLASRRATESPYRERRIHVSTTYTNTEAVFVIRDDGPGFDVAALPDPRDPGYLDRPHGRGLLLMRTFLDEVRYNKQGNEVTLVKRANRRNDEADQ